MTTDNGNRSAFVTALAWIFIVLAGFATLISVLQNIMIALVFPFDEMRTAMRDAPKGGPEMPRMFHFMFEYFHLFFIAFLVLSLATLISAIGLLKRKNWARLVFVAIMGFAVLWNLGGLAMVLLFSSMFADLPVPPGQPGFDASFQLMMRIIVGVNIVIGLAFAGLFAWIIKRLVSAEIRREFLAA